MIAKQWKKRTKQDKLNREQITLQQNKIMKLLDLWGEELYNVFSEYIDEDGWLTEDWSDIVEKNLRDWDEDYNDIDDKKDVYRRMYNLNYEEKDGKIRPLSQI